MRWLVAEVRETYEKIIDKSAQKRVSCRVR